ncbi:hypothetical protein C8R46DRAFT_1024634 [Mycena filopes]|nr:hypothetical protein C8R46DRAFT_1024634 [Mycena filopes]
MFSSSVSVHPRSDSANLFACPAFAKPRTSTDNPPQKTAKMESSEIQEFRDLMAYMRRVRQNNGSAAPPPTPAPTSSTPTVLGPQAPPTQPVIPAQAVPETPVTHRYQAPRTVPAPLVAPASYQPFLGMANLAPSSATLNTSHANQQRMSSANAVLPRGAGLIDQCFVEGADVPTVRAQILVYPPHDPEALDHNYYVYRLLSSDFQDHLEMNDLAYRFELQLSMPVNELLGMVVTSMANSPSAYILPTARRSNPAAAVTSLQPLALISKGRVHNNQVRARVQPIPADLTIGNMAADRNHFAADCCFADGRFIILLAVTAFPLSSLEDGRRHTCVGSRIYALFPQDASGMGEDIEDTSGGESMDERAERAEVAVQLWSSTPTRRAPPRTTRSAAVRPPTAGPSTPTVTRAIARQRVALAPRSPSPVDRFTRPTSPSGIFRPMTLPASIWDENDRFSPFSSGAYNMDGSQAAVFTAATRNITPAPPPLRVRGRNIDEAADHFTEMLDRAGLAGDYTELLVTDRGVSLTHGAAAYGDGPEREVIYTVFRRFLQKEATFFVRGEEDCLLVRTMFPASIPIPPSRLAELRRLGAICGLLLVFGQFPAPISVAIFQYIFNHGNFHSLRSSFVQEWFPQLAALLAEFQALSPTDDLTAFQPHLVTHLNIEASAFNHRDLSMHQRLAVMMLYRPIIAEVAFDQQELCVFAESVLLPCRNGFNLGKAVRNFEGGSETFLSLVATSYISSPDSLLPHLESPTQPQIGAFVSALRHHTTDTTITFDMLLERFLRAVGTPCPILFQAARSAFHPIIDLSRIDTPGFRSQALAWAVTGSPFIDPTAGRITIGPVSTTDPSYSTPLLRDMHAGNGVILFRTCLRTALYPVDYVFQLAQAQYSPESEPSDFQEAFDFWLLQQCLLAIGRHNIL